MSNLKRNINRFLIQNRNKGIPNLLLWVMIGNAAVFVLSLFYTGLPGLLSFDIRKIFSGQVWRLFTFPFTEACNSSSIFFVVLTLYFYFWIGKALEGIWGTLKLNLFYFSGILFTDLAAVLIYLIFEIPILVPPSYLHATLFLAIATLIPEQRVLLFFIIPIKMKWMALVDIGLTAYTIVSNLVTFSGYFTTPVWMLIIWLGTAAIVAFLNYLLYFGRDFLNLFPGRNKVRRKKPVPPPKTDAQPNPNWAKNYRSASGERPYRHKCTVCGRTDTDCPDLEFRYCSKCAGYFCYCIDHINNHTHVQ